MVFLIDYYREEYYLSSLSEKMNKYGIFNTILVSSDLKLYWLMHDSIDDVKKLQDEKEIVINNVILRPAIKIKQDLPYIENFGKDFSLNLDIRLTNRNGFSTDSMKNLFGKINESKFENDIKYFLSLLFINSYFNNTQTVFSDVTIDNAKKIFEQNKIVLLETVIDNIENIIFPEHELLNYKDILERYVEIARNEDIDFELYNKVISNYLNKKTSNIIINIIEQKEWWHSLVGKIEKNISDYENNVLYKFINDNKLVSKNIEIDNDIEEVKTDIKRIKIKQDVANKYYLIGFGYANNSRELLKKAFKEILNYDVLEVITSPGIGSFKLEGLILESENKIEMTHVSIVLKNIFKNWHLSQHSSMEAWNEIECRSNKEILDLLIEPSLNKAKKVKF